MERENTLIICYNYGSGRRTDYFNRKKCPRLTLITQIIFTGCPLKEIQNILLIGKNPGQRITGPI